MRCLLFLGCLSPAAFLTSPSAPARQSPGRPVPPTVRRFLMAHYMPWFEAAPERRSWGWHWTMNHFHPERAVGGKPEAASHYFPLLGLYDSSDLETTQRLRRHTLHPAFPYTPAALRLPVRLSPLHN